MADFLTSHNRYTDYLQDITAKGTLETHQKIEEQPWCPPLQMGSKGTLRQGFGKDAEGLYLQSANPVGTISGPEFLTVLWLQELWPPEAYRPVKEERPLPALPRSLRASSPWEHGVVGRCPGPGPALPAARCLHNK